MAGAAGAALIKLIDNVVQFFLARRAKRKDEEKAKEDADKEKEASIDDVLAELAEIKGILLQYGDTLNKHGNALRVTMYDKLDYLTNRFIKEGSVPLGVRKDVDIIYRSYKNDLDANGDLAATMELFYALPIRPT